MHAFNAAQGSPRSVTNSRCHVVPGLRRPALTRCAKPAPNLLHQRRTVSSLRDFLRGVADDNPALEQQSFNVAQAQPKPEIPTHCTIDDEKALDAAVNERLGTGPPYRSTNETSCPLSARCGKQSLVKPGNSHSGRFGRHGFRQLLTGRSWRRSLMTSFSSVALPRVASASHSQQFFSSQFLRSRPSWQLSSLPS